MGKLRKFQSTSPVWRTTCVQPDARSVTSTFQSTSPVWRTTGRNRLRYEMRLIFQSTSPVWRTTQKIHRIHSLIFHFNPRPPCGGRPLSDFGDCHGITISIHVPRVEDDNVHAPMRTITSNFNPRPPCGGRRLSNSDFSGNTDFNPRPPCGGRPSLR